MAKNYRSELVGAFGCPIDENPTGVMEEAAFAKCGLDFRYLTIKVNKGDLKAAMDGVRAFNMRGINLTIPHKVEVLKYLDELSPAAEIIGAVNMVVNNNGKLWGENTYAINTDSVHLIHCITPLCNIRNKRERNFLI